MAKRPGLYANSQASYQSLAGEKMRRRIKAGSGEKMRKAGSKGRHSLRGGEQPATF